MNNEIPRSACKLPSVKFETVPSTSIKKTLIRMNKQCNAQRSTKSLQRFYCMESMDRDTDNIVANFNLEAMINN